MIKNGKYFVEPLKSCDNFKVLFARLAAEGAGRPVDTEGYTDGPWTPELLTEAICAIEANKSGIELRTVQLWFQDNVNGISPRNLRWLARIFGCNDPVIASQWQAVLSAANRRLAEERRTRRKSTPTIAEETSLNSESIPPSAMVGESNEKFNLAIRTEALFTNRSSMTLPATIFIGTISLGLIAYSLNIHSVIYAPVNGPSRQIGFLWAPNWTINLMLVLPIFLVVLNGVLKSWQNQWREELVPTANQYLLLGSWRDRVAGSSSAIWATFIVTVLLASIFNWLAVYLLPLLNGDAGGWPVNWGKIALFQPDLISINSAIVFTGLVFIFNAFCAYVFFSGIVFLFTITQDYIDIADEFQGVLTETKQSRIIKIRYMLMHGIFRCCALGLILTISMKLQSSYLQSGRLDILDWLLADVRSLLNVANPLESTSQPLRSAPGQFYSFFSVIAIFGTFANASFRMRSSLPVPRDIINDPTASVSWRVMNIVMVLLVLSYLMIGVVSGFTIILLIVLTLTVFLVMKPINFRDYETEGTFDE